MRRAIVFVAALSMAATTAARAEEAPPANQVRLSGDVTMVKKGFFMVSLYQGTGPTVRVECPSPTHDSSCGYILGGETVRIVGHFAESLQRGGVVIIPDEIVECVGCAYCFVPGSNP